MRHLNSAFYEIGGSQDLSGLASNSSPAPLALGVAHLKMTQQDPSLPGPIAWAGLFAGRPELV